MCLCQHSLEAGVHVILSAPCKHAECQIAIVPVQQPMLQKLHSCAESSVCSDALTLCSVFVFTIGTAANDQKETSLKSCTTSCKTAYMQVARQRICTLFILEDMHANHAHLHAFLSSVIRPI